MSSTTLWAVVGLICIILEMMSATFVLLFFGVAALVVAVVKLGGLDNITIEVALFSFISVMSLVLFRKKVKANFQKEVSMKLDANQVIKISSDIPARGQASIMYQGSPWTAINESERGLKSGESVEIIRTEGIKLIVRPLN